MKSAITARISTSKSLPASCQIQPLMCQATSAEKKTGRTMFFAELIIANRPAKNSEWKRLCPRSWQVSDRDRAMLLPVSLLFFSWRMPFGRSFERCSLTEPVGIHGRLNPSTTDDVRKKNALHTQRVPSRKALATCRSRRIEEIFFHSECSQIVLFRRFVQRHTFSSIQIS